MQKMKKWQSAHSAQSFHTLGALTKVTAQKPLFDV
jgi:hypothetical protein